MKKYAITCSYLGGVVWYYEKDMPEMLWSTRKSDAKLFDTIKDAEAAGLLIVTKFPDLYKKVALFEGEEADFGRRVPAKGDLPKGPLGDVVDAIFGALFGGGSGGQVRGDKTTLAPNQPPAGEGRDPAQRRDRRRPPRP